MPTAPSSPAPQKFRATGISRFLKIRRWITEPRKWLMGRMFGMDIHPTAEISLSAKLDTTFGPGVHIGEHSYIAFETRILCHDRTRGLRLHTRIGRNCFIGGRSLILPGVDIGDGCVVGAGSVVTRSVPAGSVVAGNPAKVLREGIVVGPYGRFPDADGNEAALAASGAA